MHFLSACKDQQYISESALHTWLGQEGHAQESRALLCQHSSVLHSTWNHLFHSISILYYNPSLIPGVELGHKGQKTSAEEVVHPQRAAVPVKHPLHSRDPEHHQPSSLLLLTKAKQGISPQTAAFCQSHKQLCGSLCALAEEQRILLASTSDYSFHGELLLCFAHYITLSDSSAALKTAEVTGSGFHFHLVKCNLESLT